MFTFIFHLLLQGRTITKYEQMQSLFAFLKMFNYLSKHWNDSVGWKFVESLHHVVLNATKEIVLASNFISISTKKFEYGQ
jgi:hypothetical protein